MRLAIVQLLMKRDGRTVLRAGETLADQLHAQLTHTAAQSELVRSFFKQPSAAYITDE